MWPDKLFKLHSVIPKKKKKRKKEKEKKKQ
jgi:hypothetical protein